MNAFRKSFFYISIGLIVFGLIAIIIGAAFGGLAHGFNFQNSEDKTYSYDSDEIKSINIEIDAGNIKIKTGDEFKIVANNIVSSNLESDVNSGVWEIKYSLQNSRIFGNISFGFGHWFNSSSEIVIFIPDNIELEDLNLEFGAGNFEITDLEVNELNLEVGAGNVEIEDLIANSANIDAGVGKVSLSGKILGDSNVKCGVGQIELDLDGNYEDYNYEIQVGLGSAKINNESYSGVADKTINHSESVGTFSIDCGVGEVILRIS